MPRSKTLKDSRQFTIMVPASELREWKRYAVKHYEGNVSQFIRTEIRKVTEKGRSAS